MTNFADIVYSMGVPLPLAGPLPTLGGYRIVDPAPSDPDRYGGAFVYRTIADALEAAAEGDTIIVKAGDYDESLLVDKAHITIIGAAGRGGVAISPSTAAAEGMQVTASDVTLINIGVAGEATSSYALNVHAASRFRAYGCKFEGPTGTVVLLDGTADGQVADALFSDCEFCWGGSAIVFDDSSYGYPTQVFVDRCRFHNLVTAGLGIASGGLVKDLHLTNSIFGNAEDGTAPTDYLLLSSNSNTGFVSGCLFATATNATGVLTIGTGIKWSANATEAGWSTARPS